MYEITARDMLRFEPSDLWEHMTGDFTLVFDNGEKIVTNAIMTFFSSFAWVYHRKYPLTPLLPKHHVQVLLNGKRYSAMTHLDLLGVALESTYASYLDLGEQLDRDVLAEVLFYDGMSAIYNDWSYRFEEYVASISILNFTEILDDPEIKANKEAQVPEAWSIEEAYKVMDRVLNDPAKFQNNPVVLAYRSKLVNANQLQQSLGPRGYVTDTDSHQFRYPIMRGYVEGLRRFYDSLIESRSASKALQFSKANLRDAEYFSRKLQLACMQVKRLHKGDCGAKEYLLWTVQGEKIDDDGRKTKGDLPLIIGANYLDEESGTLKAIQGNEKHLWGRTIKLRNPIFCNHIDADGICETCFGELSLQVPKQTNIGHLCCVTMTEPSTQSVLSVKHLDGNATIESIVLDMADVMFMKPSRDRQSYLLHERLAKLSPKLIIPSEDALALNDIMSVDDVEDFNISRISELEILGIQFIEKGQKFLHSAQVHMGKRKSSMTYGLLNHIRSQGRVEINNEGNFVIDLAGWNYAEPILSLPLRHFNMSDHSKEISAMLQATKDQMQARDKKGARPTAFLVEFFNMVNNKLSVNLAPLSVILYSIMIVSAENEDYRLPKPWTSRGIGTYDFTMSRRSLSATMAYQDHYDVFISPESFVLGNRPDHIFDGLLLPYELYGGQQQQQSWVSQGGQYALQ